MSHVTCRVPARNGVTIVRVALVIRTHREATHHMSMQILVVTIVAIVFLVRLTVALYDRPTRKPGS